MGLEEATIWRMSGRLIRFESLTAAPVHPPIPAASAAAGNLLDFSIHTRSAFVSQRVDSVE